MKKIILSIIIILILLLVVLLYFIIFGFQSLSVDKKINTPGESIKIKWLDYTLEFCTCRNNSIYIYHKEGKEWKKVDYKLGHGFNKRICLDGKLISLPMPCDVVQCSFPKLSLRRGEFNWNGKIYELNGKIDYCEGENGNFDNIQIKNALIGEYKVKSGRSEATFTISEI